MAAAASDRAGLSPRVGQPAGGGVLDSRQNPETVYVWREGGMMIQVVFKDGKVVQKSKSGG